MSTSQAQLACSATEPSASDLSAGFVCPPWHRLFLRVGPLLHSRRSRHWRWKGGRIEVSARAIGPDRSGSKAEMVLIDVVFAARVFLNLLVGFSSNPGPRVLERLSIELRILDQRFDMDVVRVRSRPPLHHVKRVAVRICVFVNPELLVFESDRVDDQCVSFPVANLLSEERRVGVFRMF